MEGGVPAGVLGEVVAPHETLVAQRAGEALLSGVRTDVTRQLVGARELLDAVRPRAQEGSFTCMHS